MGFEFFYFAARNTFLPAEMRADYEEAGTWPEGAIAISAEVYERLQAAQFEGKVIVADSSGFPIAVDEPPQTAEQLAAAILAQRDDLLREAAIRIAPLQDAVDLNDASEVEQGALLAWKRYRVTLSRIQNTVGFPQSVEWPAAPA